MSSAPIGVESFSSWCRRSASQAPPVRMPTSPVDSVTPARSFRTSSSHSVSASGRSIQITLQNDLSGEGVDRLLAFALAEAGFAERFFGRGRGKPLVSEFYRKPEARFEPTREAPRAPRHVVLAAVHRERQADHQLFGPPFAHKGFDLRHAPAGACRLEHSQRIGEPRFGVTHRDADPARAEIESKYGVAGDLRRGHGRLAHACPASSDNLAKSIPSSFIAAGSRSSVGVSKMIPSFASTVSQAFCLISFSSCPAAQPA